MSRFQGAVGWIAISAEISHFFCCGIPIIFSVMSLLMSTGLVAAMPVGLDSLHHAIHDYEKPMIALSALIITMGWALHYIAKRIDCRSTGCGHTPCGDKKQRSTRILKLASILFAVNLASYFLLHT